MILSPEEYRSMGFSWENEEQLRRALMRADILLSALTNDKSSAAVAAGGKAALLVKQAAAFQTYELLRAEYPETRGGSSEQRVSIGDFSYSMSESAPSTQSGGVSCGQTIIALLNAAGCLYRGEEVAE